MCVGGGRFYREEEEGMKTPWSLREGRRAERDQQKVGERILESGREIIITTSH